MAGSYNLHVRASLARERGVILLNPAAVPYGAFPYSRRSIARVAGSYNLHVRASLARDHVVASKARSYSLLAGFMSQQAQAAFDGGQAVFEAGLHVVDGVLNGFAQRLIHGQPGGYCR